jgi:hypothetical protein
MQRPPVTNVVHPKVTQDVIEGDFGAVVRFLRAVGQYNRMLARREQRQLALARRRRRNKAARASRKRNRA